MGNRGRNKSKVTDFSGISYSLFLCNWHESGKYFVNENQSYLNDLSSSVCS